MTRLFITVFSLFLTQVAHANQVAVSSGEHPEFTRVILEFENLPDWRSEQIGRSHRILFSDASLSFDLSRAFRLIGRERLSDLRVAEDGIELDIACDCDVVVTAVAENALAADIRPRKGNAPRPVDAVGSMVSPEIDSLDMVLPSAPMPLPGRVAPARPSLEAPTQESLFDPGQLLPVQRDVSDLRNLDILLEEASGRGTAVELLGQQLSRAAAQGLVEAEAGVKVRPRISTPGLSGLEDRSNLSIETGIDRAINPGLDHVPPTQTGAVCLSNSQVDVAAWGDASDPRALGQHRSAAIAEDGGLDPDGAHSLARFYLAMGFGAEAKTVAAHADPDVRPILFALGDIMDRGHSSASILAGQISCDGKVALWAALAGPIDSTEQSASMDIILSTFSALPPHLRTHLGPILSERLRELDLSEESRAVINAMTRGGDSTEESELATARLDLAGNGADDARETLSDLSEGTDTTAAEALLELLEDAERRGMAPNPAWVTEDVPSLVRAVEGTDIAAELNLAGLRGQIALGMFDSLRAALSEDQPGLDNSTRKVLAASALEQAVKTASDVDFIKAEIGLVQLLDPNTLSQSLRLDLADRLFFLGLDQRSAIYLSDTPDNSRELEARARVLISSGHSEAAVELLAEAEGEQAAVLLGNAYSTLGNNQAAIQAFDRAAQTESALSTAFRSGDWDWIAEMGSEDLSTAVRTLAAPAPIPTEPNPNGALIANSRDLRDQVKALLGKTKPTTFEEPFMN